MILHLNKAQVKELAQISGNLSVLFVGSVITQAFTSVDGIDPQMVVLGVAIAGIFFTESLILLKEVKDNEL
jgi:hypothetical protein